MAGAVGHVGDLAGVAAAIGFGAHLVEQLADGLHDLDVGLFVPAAHVVDLAQAPGFEHTADRTAVVFDVEPIADLHAVAIHGQGLARQGVDDHERDEFFGEVIRPVVVAAVGGEHRQAIGVVPGADQVVTGGLAGAVGAVGLVAMRFGESRIALGQRAVDLVGGHMQKPEGRFFSRGQVAPKAPHRFEQVEGAHDVGLDELARAVDGAVHMAFGREVDHRTRPMLGQQAVDQGAVADVALHQLVACVALQAGQSFGVARVGQFVEVHDRLITGSQPVQYEVGANKTCAAGHQNGHEM